MGKNEVCRECPLFEWFEGGIDAGWCGFHQWPADAEDESCEDNPTADENDDGVGGV